MEDTNSFIRDVTLLLSSFRTEAVAEEHNEDETNHHLGNGGMHGSNKCIICKITQGMSKMKASAEQKNKVKYGQSFLKTRIGFVFVSRRPKKCEYTLS
jgi:hypothetical protein